MRAAVQALLDDARCNYYFRPSPMRPLYRSGLRPSRRRRSGEGGGSTDRRMRVMDNALDSEIALCLGALVIPFQLLQL